MCCLLKVVNIEYDGDDDDDDDAELSGFLLGLAISHTALLGSWVLDVHHYRLNRQSPTCLHSRLLRHAGEHSDSILLAPKPQEQPESYSHIW